MSTTSPAASWTRRSAVIVTAIGSASTATTSGRCAGTRWMSQAGTTTWEAKAPWMPHPGDRFTAQILGIATAAQEADKARGRMGLDDHARTQEGRVDTIAQPFHGPGVFVAEDDRWVRLEMVVPDVDVGATDAGVPDADDHLARTRFAQVDLAQLELGIARRHLDQADRVGALHDELHALPRAEGLDRGLDLVRSDGAAHEWSQHLLVGLQVPSAASMSTGR